MMGKVRPQIFLAILCLTLLAMLAAYKGMPEISTATIGGIIALGMKVLENEQENTMPKVGKKNYPYTAKGKAAAKAASKRTGKKMTKKKKY